MSSFPHLLSANSTVWHFLLQWGKKAPKFQQKSPLAALDLSAGKLQIHDCRTARKMGKEPCTCLMSVSEPEHTLLYEEGKSALLFLRLHNTRQEEQMNPCHNKSVYILFWEHAQSLEYPGISLFSSFNLLQTALYAATSKS